MKQIRIGVFETNSSSTHSVTISGEDSIVTPNYIGTIRFGEYGWEKESYEGFHNKLSYVLTTIRELNDISEDLEVFLVCKHYVWLKEMVQEHCGIDLEVKACTSGWWPFGYIDHQSHDTLSDFWSDDEVEFKTKMKDFIFNEKYGFMTDNDNHD